MRQPAVGLDGEGDRRRHPGRLRRPGDADRLVEVGHGHRRHQVDAGRLEHPDLQGVIVLGLRRGHVAVGRVAVAARPDAAREHHRARRRLLGVANRREQRDRVAVRRIEGLGRVAERGAPVRVRAPGRALEHQPAAVAFRQRHVGRVVALERRAALRSAQQVEGREGRQVEPVVEDQRRLDPAVGQEEVVAHLRQGMPVSGVHGSAPGWSFDAVNLPGIVWPR